MRLISKHITLVWVLFVSACAAPELPDSGLKSGSVTITEATCEGAPIGTVQTRQSMQFCLQERRYFDRNANDGAGLCTEKRLAPFGCTLDGLKSTLSANAKAQLEEQLNNRLKGHLIDQCYEDVNEQNIPVYKCTFEDGTPESTQVLTFSR